MASVGLRGYRYSSRVLRRQEAKRLNAVDGERLRAAVTESVWVAPRAWAGLVFWGVGLSGLSLVVLECVMWALGLTGNDGVLGGNGPAGLAGWLTTALFVAFAVLFAGFWLSCWQRPWVRLDSTGITKRGLRFGWPPPPSVYQWERCGEATVRVTPTSGGQPMSTLDCPYDDHTTVTLDDYRFGDPHDLATILNAYRSVYAHTSPVDATATDRTPACKGDSPAVLRRSDAQRLEGLTGPALRDALGESTWTASAAQRYGQLGLIAACAVAWAAFLIWGASEDPTSVVMWSFMSGIGVVIGIGFAWALFPALRPPWTQLDSSGVTLGGARFPRLTPPPQHYRWDDCDPFEMHYIHDDPGRWIARGRVDTGKTGMTTVKWESTYGEPSDLVTILNAYRSAYGSVEE